MTKRILIAMAAIAGAAGCASNPNYGALDATPPDDATLPPSTRRQQPGAAAGGCCRGGRSLGRPRGYDVGAHAPALLVVRQRVRGAVRGDVAVGGSLHHGNVGDLQGGGRRDAPGAVHGQSRHHDVHARVRAGRRRSHRRALPPDRGSAGRVAPVLARRRRRHADGSARRREPPHRGRRRFDHVRLRHPRRARRQRLLPDREPLGHVRGARGARARRGGQHDRGVGPRRRPQLRRRHERHDADALPARGRRTSRARSGTSTSSRRRSSSTWARTTSATGRAIPATPSATRTGRCSRPCARTTRTRSSSASSRRC